MWFGGSIAIAAQAVKLLPPSDHAADRGQALTAQGTGLGEARLRGPNIVCVGRLAVSAGSQPAADARWRAVLPDSGHPSSH